MSMLIRTALAIALAASATPALAQSAGHWTTGYGAGYVSPKSDSGTFGGTRAEIKGAPALSFTYEYFIRNNLGIEVHAAVAGKHDLELDGIGKVGSYWSVPPSVLLQYHINGYGTVSPFVGVGINYTTFLGEDVDDAFGNGDLSFDDSVGATAHVGVDFIFNERSGLRVDARWAGSQSNVDFNGARLGKAKIDPLTYGVSYLVYF
ncbi:OmpW/AlkL family protein [Xanthomonas hortorum]|uniref:OmpW family protein n=2 Tax=Xanthomonas hortorum pv. pelargonii TaxID=453602 RepID=A0AAW9ZS55_9XANT|nr:OmpW family outer membrane protein [Xanthomonas hortorum]MCE4354685.1 outer membrane beta-barrel protein [Xanthomonas hortorum pv. pelargonii]MCM5523946.1 outer membrane beta-barrel protein [Xanthomonas hortorum pv. pelargonii]MCM5535959.1 outer membrane beta-barrel protein [Xanthomonas hortorum pv. pelargonii]MCM5540090.1 outer membrane beta-barrel protein [Xanthomonas hortorum pv. pelargonii]MCM5543984.1 outer membrane beta-barrel protein [Xanthomonas hortorum pv. pelargonii]